MKFYWLVYVIVEFINLVSSESNEVCNREERRTIAPEHVLKALGVFIKWSNDCITKVFMWILANLDLISYVVSPWMLSVFWFVFWIFISCMNIYISDREDLVILDFSVL